MSKILRGDKIIWAAILVIAITSLLPVYSASTNLVHVVGKGTFSGYLFKHIFILLMGFAILFFVHKIKHKYFGPISIPLLFVIILLLIFTLFSGTKIAGANAARWIRIPFLGVGFQTSALASLVVMVYVARYLSKINPKTVRFKKSFLELWLPVFLVCLLIFPANFSTAALLFLMICVLLFIGGYPLKFLSYIIGAALCFTFVFILFFKAFPSLSSGSRVDTWISRLENFTISTQEGYQVENAKIALATGGIFGRGPGKSVQKNFLPQSTSDFIFAIIVEEYGLLGTAFILSLYMVLLYRFFRIARNCTTKFSKFLVIAAGFPMIFQAIINLSVATNLIPVTGQPLPFFSNGGTSVWVNFIALGIILSVSHYNFKKEQQQKDVLKENNET